MLNYPLRTHGVTWYTVGSGNIETDSIWSLSGSPPGYTASLLGGLSDTVDIVIQATTIADISNITTTEVGNITVKPGGQIKNSGGGNRYLNVFGDINCDGIIGDGLLYNPISFNIEGDTCMIYGAGQFDCSRIRKNSNASTSTVLIVDMDIRLWYDQFSSTAFYNNSYGARFDLIVLPGATVRLLGASGNASFSIDGTNGAGIFDNHGTVDIQGFMEIEGVLYMSNNNSSTGDSCVFIVRNGGILRVGSIDAGVGVMANSKLILEAGGMLDLQGATPFQNFSLLTNEFIIDVNSSIDYSCSCDQVINHQIDYGTLNLLGTGNRFFQDTTLIRGDLSISGNAVSVGGTATIELKGDWNNQNTIGWNSGYASVILSGVMDQTYKSLVTDTMYTLVLTKSNGKAYLHDSLIIKDMLIMNDGNLITSDSAVLLIDSVALTQNANQNSFVDGPIVKLGNSDFNFPVGDSVYFKPLSITSLSGNSNVRVEYIRIDPMLFGYDVNILDTGLTHVSRCELWEISAPDNVAATIHLTWDSSGCGVIDPATLRMARWDRTKWVNEFYSTINGTMMQGEITSYSGVPLMADSTSCVTLASASEQQNPLPVTLRDFNLERVTEGVLVKWSTASEVNSSHFILERNNGFEPFHPLASIVAAGFSSDVVRYEYLDKVPMPGYNCYALIQFDINGTSNTFSPECIRYERPESILNCYPNPVTDRLSLNTDVISTDAVVIITDMVGRIRLRRSFESKELVGGVPIIDVGHLTGGLYELVVLDSFEDTQRCKFIVL